MEKFLLDHELGVATYADIESLPSFDPDLHLTDDLKSTAEVHDEYHIGPDMVPCGLAACHQTHGHGIVVSVVREGRMVFTNVGHICGRKHFGVSLKTAVNVHRDRERLTQRKRTINRYIDDRAELRVRLAALHPAAEELDTAVRNFKNLYDASLVEDLMSRARRNNRADYEITETRSATDAEREAGSGDFVTEHVGRLRGDLRPFICVARAKLTAIRRVMDRIDNADRDLLTDSDIRHIAEDVDRLIRKELEEVESLINRGRTFFSPENWALLGLNRPEFEWDFHSNEGWRLSEGQRKRKARRQAKE